MDTENSPNQTGPEAPKFANVTITVVSPNGEHIEKSGRGIMAVLEVGEDRFASIINGYFSRSDIAAIVHCVLDTCVDYGKAAVLMGITRFLKEKCNGASAEAALSEAIAEDLMKRGKPTDFAGLLSFLAMRVDDE